MTDSAVLPNFGEHKVKGQKFMKEPSLALIIRMHVSGLEMQQMPQEVKRVIRSRAILPEAPHPLRVPPWARKPNSSAVQRVQGVCLANGRATTKPAVKVRPNAM